MSILMMMTGIERQGAHLLALALSLFLLAMAVITSRPEIAILHLGLSMAHAMHLPGLRFAELPSAKAFPAHTRH